MTAFVSVDRLPEFRASQAAGDKAAPSGNSRGFAFRTFQSLSVGNVGKRELVKGVIALGETSGWVGPPGSLKSALLTSACVAVATGSPWRGHRNKGRAAVIYFALERGDLVARRFRAHAVRDRLDDLPIAVVTGILDLMNAATVVQMLDTVKRVESEFDLPVGLLVVDTFAKAVAAGGGDEDKARDQGIVFANLQRFRLDHPAHIALIGHTGKDETRGPRGSSAFVGDVDLLVSISGDSVKTATVTKANDAPEGVLFRFKDEVLKLGDDEDGDPITVNLVDRDDIQEAPPPTQPARRLSDRQILAIRALAEAILSHGEPSPSSLRAPQVATVVKVERWREEMLRNGTIDPKGSNPRADFSRMRDALVAREVIGLLDEYVWPVAGV
jgi:hypothetical protein